MATADPDAIPAFCATPADEMAARLQTMRASYRSGRTKTLDFRLRQIRRLYWGLVDCGPLIEEALMRDLHKSKFEANISEITWCQTECLDVAAKLRSWAKDEAVVNLPLLFRPMSPRIRHEPLGCVLIISAYNYPFYLGIVPVIGAIAAGNCLVLKPSEHSPNCAMVLKKLIDDYLDPDCFLCINGNIPETQTLLDFSFDKILFTGGKHTGTIIAAKAAQSLTPVILELGGRNPAFVTANADLSLAARRLLWQKCLNAGQVCLSHNYVLVQRPVVDEFIRQVNRHARIFMPQGAKASPDFGRIVNKTQFDRIKAMLDNTRGKIVMGGSLDESDLFIEPTAVLVDDIEDSMMADESFGPIWSIMPFDSLDQAIDIANSIDATPLALFTFGSNEENEKVLANVTSGGATINDSFFHNQINPTPLGGIGSSGMGSYHGYYSFRAFSHQRVIASVPSWVEPLVGVRYMPYSYSRLRRLNWLVAPKPNFDRDGNLNKGVRYWLGLLLGLGGKNPSGSALSKPSVIASTTAKGQSNKDWTAARV